MDSPLLTLSGVAKNFGDVQALTHVDLKIHPGQVVGLVGGNGAGKTTLLRLMAGVMEPSHGSVMFQNSPVSQLRSKLGVVPESSGLYSRLTAWENIRYHSRMYGIDDNLAWARVTNFAQSLDLVDALSRHTKGFSRGMRQKTALLRALAHGPEILLLDEPTAGINPTLINGLIDRLKRANEEMGVTLFVIEHNMRVVMNLASHVFCLAHGKLLAGGPPSEIQNDQKVIDAYLGAH